MAAQKTYTTTFAVGAKLLGSFKGVMAAAHSRMRSLEHAALRVGKAFAKMATVFGGLGAIIGAFGIGKVFSEIFEGADQAASDFNTRTRKLTMSLLQNQEIAKGGMAVAEKQKDLIYEHNEALAKQGVISKELLDTAATNLAVVGVPPKYIMQASGEMADLLVVAKGVNATQEDMSTFSKAYAVAIKTGMTRGLRNYGIVLSDTQAKQFKDFKQFSNYAELRYKFLMEKGKFATGANLKAAMTAGGKIRKLHNDMEAMQIRMGLAALPARGKMADAWRAVLPELEPIFNSIRNAGFTAMGKVAEFVKDFVVPSFKTLSAWWKGEGGKAFMTMISQLGKAFLNMIGFTKDAKQSWGQLVQAKLLAFLNGLTKAFEWIGKNAKWLVPTITTLVVAFTGLLVAFEVATAIAAIANPVGLIILGIGALIAAVVLLYENWDTIKQMFPETAAIVEHFIAGFKASFQFAIDFVIAIWKTLYALFTGDFTGIGDAWKKVWTDIVAIAEWWKKTLIEIAKAVGQAFKDYFLKVFEDIKSIWTWMKGFSWSGVKKMFSEGQAAAAAYGEQMSTGQVGGAGGYGGAGANAAAVAPVGSAAAAAAGALPPEASAKLAAERAEMVADLSRPELRNLVSATLATEQGGAEGQKDVLEAMVNRAVAYKRAGKYQGMEQMIKGGFYGPYNRGETAAVMAKGLSDQRSEQVKSMIAEISTRNALRGMTDQGMINEIKGQKANIGGEYYGFMEGLGEQFKTAAYTESVNASKQFATGGVVTRPTLATVGEKGPEAIIPLRGRGRGGDTHMSYAPNITINGNATEAEQRSLESRLRAMARDFVSDFKRAQHHERRLSYEGGYG